MKTRQLRSRSLQFAAKTEQKSAPRMLRALAVGTDDGLKVGKDCAKAAVSAKVLKNGKAKKVTILTYKPKKGEKRKMGHRQPYTKIQIESVQG